MSAQAPSSPACRSAREVPRTTGPPVRETFMWSPMVSDDERNWGHWGRVGARPAVPWGRLSWSPMMSEIGGIGAGQVSRARACALPHSLRSERNWGQLGPGGCHALRGLWSHELWVMSAQAPSSPACRSACEVPRTTGPPVRETFHFRNSHITCARQTAHAWHRRWS